MADQDFRTCPTTGLKVHLPAENLIKANAVAAVVLLLIGGIAALGVALTRWPAVHLLPADWFYRMLTLHGLAMLIAWIIFFEIAGLYLGASVLLSARLAAPKVGWLAFVLMVVGVLLIAAMVLTGQADVLFTSYPPLQAHPLYYLGVILFAVGALIGCFIFFATLYKARKEGTYPHQSFPLVTFGLACAAMIAVVTLLHGAAIYIPTLLWSLGLMGMDPSAYRLVFWGLGHPSQQINVAAMISVWYLLGTLTVGMKPINQKLCRTAFVLYVLFINVASEHHILVDPVFSNAHKIWNTGYVMHLAVLASMIHALAVPAGIEVALRKKGYTSGLFEWLKKAPWSNPAFSALMLSIFGFGFMGGITGVTFGTEQVNITAHNTWRITGHFHATVVFGTTLAFMGVTYYVLPLIFRREVLGMSWAKLQPWFFGIGMMLVSGGMMLAGAYGIPRRHWDIVNFGGSPFAFTWDPTVFMWLGVFGIGALLAAVGGAIYILVTVGTILFGKKLA
ncbi:MAG: cbb3-type cytochrome c oxidase subunit I [Deltaproteobacteria bacterium]|nr:cbb3-type cytochrome c oxidase subunit I [Deltaproteobacteria bacterium]